MRRTSTMTMGFVLIFIGIQLNLVETYVLTPRFSNFLSENRALDLTGQTQSPFMNQAAAVNSNRPMNFDPQLNANQNNPNAPYNSPYYQASFANGQMVAPFSSAANLGQPKTFSPPKWLCWPALFLGAVLFLQGLSIPRNNG
ncbi:MAG: hypothetical protein AB8B55_16585 [Mariniblastus sp.]